MVLRKDRLWKQCKVCGKMYKPYTKKAGICSKCKPESFLDKVLKKQKQMEKKK